MKKVFLYSHGGSGNHGCEAIVRTTKNIIGDAVTSLYSMAVKEDIKYGVSDIVDIKSAHNKPSLIKRAAASMQIKLFHNNSYSEFLDMAHQFKGGDVAVSVGGDNYCYKGVEEYFFKNKVFNKHGVKTVLWGCSVEPDMISDAMAEDLGRYSLITARESITYEAVKKFNKNTYLYPDPAFTLEKAQVELPEQLQGKKFVGINLSPHIISCNSDSNIVADTYERLVEYILNNTSYSVLLVPHVVWNSNDDRKVLKPISDKFSNTGRVVLLDDCNCMQLKGYISQCDMFIGARTHATIAAYSTCVPTLVVGYSVKARGIAKDIFGTEGNYVLPVQSLKNEDDLVNAFIWLSENKESIKEHLHSFMPSYISKAYESGKKFAEILG